MASPSASAVAARFATRTVTRRILATKTATICAAKTVEVNGLHRASFSVRGIERASRARKSSLDNQISQRRLGKPPFSLYQGGRRHSSFRTRGRALLPNLTWPIPSSRPTRIESAIYDASVLRPSFSRPRHRRTPGTAGAAAADHGPVGSDGPGRWVRAADVGSGLSHAARTGPRTGAHRSHRRPGGWRRRAGRSRHGGQPRIV